MLKRIFAIVSDNDFYKFRARAKEEANMDLAQAFATLTHLYAIGKIDLKHHEPKTLKEAEGEQTDNSIPNRQH